jgi:hypothetical protein
MEMKMLVVNVTWNRNMTFCSRCGMHILVRVVHKSLLQMWVTHGCPFLTCLIVYAPLCSTMPDVGHVPDHECP